MSSIALAIIVSLLGLAISMSAYRLLRGPTAADRVVALDIITVFGIGVVVVQAIVFNEPAYLDIVIIIALVAFLGTVASAYYLERRGDK